MLAHPSGSTSSNLPFEAQLLRRIPPYPECQPIARDWPTLGVWGSAPASNQSPQSVIPCGSAAQGTRRSGSGAPFANRRSCMTGAIDTCDIMVAPVQRGESQIRTSARVAQAVDVCLDVPLAKAAFCCPSATNSAARVPRLLRTACNLDVSRQNLCESLAFTFGTCVYFRTRRNFRNPPAPRVGAAAR